MTRLVLSIVWKLNLHVVFYKGIEISFFYFFNFIQIYCSTTLSHPNPSHQTGLILLSFFLTCLT